MTTKAMAGSSRFAILFTAFAGAAAVALGAFGAHGLKPILERNGSMDVWRTAALYHLVHSVALLAVVACPRRANHRARNWTVRFWAAGILFFSGSLYAMALGAPRWLGPITPVGGMSLLLGWLTAGFWLWQGTTDGESGN